MIKTICDFCGKDINVKPSKLKKFKHHFCSKECCDNWQRKNTSCGKSHSLWKQKTLTCDFCNKKFYRSPSLINDHNFCSYKCYFAWKKENTPKGENSPRWNSIKMPCEYCKKEIYVKPSLIGTRKNHFCSKICSANWKREHYPKGEDNQFFKMRKIQCAYCGKEIWLKQYRIKNFENNFCSRKCTFKWKRENTPRGKNSPLWNGGGFRYYGGNWFSQKRKVRKRANHLSEINGDNNGKMMVHHILPLRLFIQRYINLCLMDIPSVKQSSFKVLPYDLIPEVIFEEANVESNLVYLTSLEHHHFEGMPPTFFEAVRIANK